MICWFYIEFSLKWTNFHENSRSKGTIPTFFHSRICEWITCLEFFFNDRPISHVQRLTNFFPDFLIVYFSRPLFTTPGLLLLFQEQTVARRSIVLETLYLKSFDWTSIRSTVRPQIRPKGAWTEEGATPELRSLEIAAERLTGSECNQKISVRSRQDLSIALKFHENSPQWTPVSSEIRY